MISNSAQQAAPAAKPAAAAPHFPVVHSKDLNGRELTLPQDLPGDRAILLVAWEREQQKNLDTWSGGLHLTGAPAAGGGNVPWLELPVIDNPGAVARWFINSGMRRGIKDQQVWAHVVTLYTKKADLNAALGIASEQQVQAMVVDRQGNILAREVGDYTAAGGARLLAALGH